MTKSIATPKNYAWTGRVKKAAEKAGFGWDGLDMSMESEKCPHAPWGCVVRKYRPPAPPRKGFGVIAGMLLGMYDEFGKPIR